MTLAIIFDGVGLGEWFVLLAVILIVVGPKRLPSAARQFGNYYAKFRRAAESFKRQLMDMDTEITNLNQTIEREIDSAIADVNESDSAGMTGADAAATAEGADLAANESVKAEESV